MVLHIQVIVMQQQKVLRNKVFIHWPTIILKSSLSVMGNTCLEIKLDMKRRQIQTTLSDRTRFKVEQYEDNSFSFYYYVKKKYVGIKGTSLVWKDNVDDTCRFELELTEGNNPFPEADVNIDFYDEDGNPITTSNVMARPSSGENIIGTAILMHICVITKDPERLYLMEMHLVPWELQMHSMIVRICTE